MPDFAQLAGIGEAFIAAAIDPLRWNEAMEVAARATGSFGAALLPRPELRTPAFPRSETLELVSQAYVKDGWIKRDLRNNALPTLIRVGAASDFDFISHDEMLRHPFYQEFLAPQGLRWFASVKVGDGPDLWCLSLQRSIVEGPFTPNELRRLADLSRRLSGAAELARAFGFARAEAALQAFETSGSPAAMMDSNAEVLRLNGSAERLLDADLKIVGRRIVSFDPDATAALDRALHSLIWAVEPEALHPPIPLRRRGRRPILAYPSRAPSGLEAFAQCRGFVAFVDLEARLVVEAADLARAFALTPAEARLASRMFEDDSIETAADKLGVAYETARKILKNVFAKTDTHRQGQLVALMARIGQRNQKG